MGLLFDKYVPQEGFNTIFSDIKNCEVEIRPSKEGFQAPLFFIKKRLGLTTKSGISLIYKGTALEQSTGATFIDPTDTFRGFSGYKIYVKTATRIQTVYKPLTCTATRASILDENKNVLVTKDFTGVLATFNRVMPVGTYYIVVDSADVTYVSNKNLNTTFPIEGKLLNFVAGYSPGIEMTALSTYTYPGTTYRYGIRHYISRGVRIKAKKDLIVRNVVKVAGSEASQCRFLKDDGTLIASANFDGVTATFTSSFTITANTYFRVELYSSGNRFNTPYGPASLVDTTAVEFNTGSSNGANDGNAYGVLSIGVQETSVESSTIGYNITKVIAEDGMVATSEGQRDTVGEVMGSQLFNNMIYMYTTEGYIYTFDGVKLSVVLANTKNIAISTSDTDYILNNEVNKQKQANEFTPLSAVVLKDLNVKIKTEGDVSVSALLKCVIVDADNKDTIISISKTVLDKTSLSNVYQIVTFSFDNVLLTSGKKYCFYVECYNTKTTGYFKLSGASANAYASHKSYVSTSTGTWTENTGTLRFSCNMTAALTLKTDNYDQGISVVSYIGGGRYPSDTIEYTVSSYDEPNGKITIAEGGLVAANLIGKYIYISSGGVARYQQRAISDIPSANVITLAVGLQTPTVAGDKIQIYNSMESQLRFPQLRKGTSDADLKRFFSYDIKGNQRYMYFPEKRALLSWDNRIIQMTKDKQALIASSSIDYEIPITVSVTFGNSQALSMAVYGGYLMVFFANKIGLVKKDVIDSATGEFAYLYQDLLDIGLYSAKSFIVQGGNLYIFANDKRLYSVDLSTISLGEIIAKLSDQGQVLLNYFNTFSGGDVRMFYNGGTLYVVYRPDTGSTKVFKYMETFKAWITDEYEYTGNFFNFLYSIGQTKYTVSQNRIYKFFGTRDGEKKITQHIKMYGPVQGLFDLYTLTLVKLRLGFDGTGIGGTVTTTIGGYQKFVKSWDLASIDVVKEINAAIEADGTMGSDQYGNTIYGGEAENFGRLQDIYSEMLDVSFKVGKRGSYHTIELTNTTDKQMIVGGIVPYYNTDNPLFVSNKGVLS